MSILQRRQKLQRLLFMLEHKQMQTAAAAAKHLLCHQSTIEKMLQLLRKEGYLIIYDKILKRYRLEGDEKFQK